MIDLKTTIALGAPASCRPGGRSPLRTRSIHVGFAHEPAGSRRSQHVDLIVEGDYEQVGTFNGNPLTMASAKAVLTEILDDDARKARADLRRLADRAGIESSFRVARGAVTGEILAAAAEADLVILGRIGWTVRRRRDLGKTARELISRGRRVLLLERSAVVKPPIVVLYDGSDAGADALDLAAHLADRRGDQLQLLLVGADEGELRANAAGRGGPAAETRWLGRPGPKALARAVSRRRGGVVIVPVTGPGLGEEHLRTLLDNVACPVLAVS